LNAGDTPPAPVFDPARRNRATALVAGVGVVVVGIDLLVKQLTVANLEGHDPVRILGGLIYLMCLRNSGAAFSFGTDATWVFPCFAVIVIGVIAWLTRRLASLPWAVSYGLILGGAAGNLGDRIFRAPGFFVGHVVDMISVLNSQGTGFPVFNIADSALTCGVALAVLLEFTGRRRDGSRVVKT
jgi:signal peptidase II